VSFSNFSEVELIAQKRWPIYLVFCASTSGFGFKMTVAKVRLAMAAMGKPKTKVADLCRELGVPATPFTDM
jgi:hypothetical protein